jgi:hypothetical protein
MKTTICKAINIDRKETKDKTLSSPSPRSGRVLKSVLSKIRKFLYNNIEFKWLKFIQILCGIYILIVTFTYSGTLGVFGVGARDRKTGFIIDPNHDVNTRNGIIECYANPVFDGNSATVPRAIVASSSAQMVLLGLSVCMQRRSFFLCDLPNCLSGSGSLFCFSFLIAHFIL